MYNTYIVRVALWALLVVLIDSATYFKATLQYLSALLVVVLFLVERYGYLSRETS